MAMLLIVLLVIIPISLAKDPMSASESSGADAKKASGKKCETDADCPVGLFRYSCDLPADSSSSKHKCQLVPEPPTECNVVVCEGGSMQLSCPAGKTLSVLSAMYGRLDASICPHRNIFSTNCTSTTSDAIVQAACDGQQICLVAAKNSDFGNPCGNTYKYLDVTYICQ